MCDECRQKEHCSYQQVIYLKCALAFENQNDAATRRQPAPSS